MRINPYIFILVFTVLLSTACSQRAICPAFQSSFILDNEEREQFFTLFVEDSLPKQDHLVVKDTRGLLASVSYKGKQKSYEMEMVPMKTIFPALDQEELDSLMILAQMDSVSANDSLATPVYQPKLPGYNRDQRIYQELFGDYYYEQTNPKKPSKEEGKEKGSWFKRLFNWKKKDKQKEEPEGQEQPQENATGKVSEDMAKN